MNAPALLPGSEARIHQLPLLPITPLCGALARHRDTVVKLLVEHEPVRGHITQIDPLAEEIAYNSVFEAMLDGWRVIHFPDQRAPFDDREIDIVGYEFILEKLESYEHE